MRFRWCTLDGEKRQGMWIFAAFHTCVWPWTSPINGANAKRGFHASEWGKDQVNGEYKLMRCIVFRLRSHTRSEMPLSYLCPEKKTMLRRIYSIDQHVLDPARWLLLLSVCWCQLIQLSNINHMTSHQDEKHWVCLVGFLLHVLRTWHLPQHLRGLGGVEW